jgi:hypothetical protein
MHVRAPAGRDLHLFQRLVQGVSIVRVARHCPHADDEAALGRGATLTFVPNS